MYPPCGAGKTISPHLRVYDFAHARHLLDVLAEGGAHHNPASVVVLGPCDLAGIEVDLPTHMDQVLCVVKVGAVQRKDFAGTHRLIANREDGSLKDESILIDATLSRASAQPLVLLVTDDLEVGSVNTPLALAYSETGEVIALDQVAVKRVVEELTHGLLNVGVLGKCPCECFVAGEAVKAAVVKLSDERSQAVA